jgi:hypothetical protein
MIQAIIILMLWVVGAVAQTTISPNPLAGLPSQPGPTIALINAMGDNSWLNLGRPAPDPVWGSGRGCSWGGRSMALAPELRGAFHSGEGVHCAIKPDGFGMDDYWFYDINGHRWICVYPGTDTRNFSQKVANGELKVDSLGRAVDASGQPIPAHMLGHTYGRLDYDTYQKKLRINGDPPYGRYQMPGLACDGYPTSPVEAGLAALEAQGLNKAGHTFAPWAYNTLTGKFERDPANAQPFRGNFENFLYAPTLKRLLLIGGEGVASFDPATNLWSRVTITGVNPGGYEFGACYDSKRDRFYLGDILSQFYSYDVQTRTGTKISTTETYPMNFTFNQGSACYDSINDVVLIFDFIQHEIYLFDPEANTWKGAIPFSYTITNQTNRAFYDPQLGVCFILSVSDSDDKGIMWVYKFRGSAVAEKEKSLRSVKLIAEDAVVEQYLWSQLKIVQTYQSLPTDTTSSLLATIVTNLTPSKISVSDVGLLRALDTGTARIAIEKKGFKDTLTIPIVTSTAATDSVVISPDIIRFVANDSFQLSCMGYFRSGGKTFSRPIAADAAWQSALPSVVTVDQGNLHSVSAGGPVEITATYSGKSSKSYTVIWPRPAVIKRINFQCSSTPWSYGWLADNGLAYSSVSGRGWTTTGLSCRDDRGNARSFLLRSFVYGTGHTVYKVNVPDGSYIIKGALGDCDYGGVDTLWYGNEMIAAHDGYLNLIFQDTLTVSGGQGLALTLNGKINYLVVISNEGIDINTVADDNGLVPNYSSLESTARQRPLPLALSVSPTPFNPSCRIRFSLPAASHVRLEVYDLAGRHIRTLADGMFSMGAHGFTWSGIDQTGRPVGTGVYAYRLTAGNKVLAIKGVFAK